MILDIIGLVFLFVFFYRTLIKLKIKGVKFILFDYFPKVFNVSLKYLTYTSVSLAILYLFLVLTFIINKL
jgi:hypothetical protein